MPMTRTHDAHRTSLDSHMTVLNDDLLDGGSMVMVVTMPMVRGGWEGDESGEERRGEEGELVHDLCFSIMGFVF